MEANEGIRLEMEKEYINRLFDEKLDFYLKSVGAIQIVGPKWCGKSRTAKRHAKTVIDLMRQSDRDQFVPLAKQAPEVLLDYGERPLLIDEWQVIPFIWNSLKRKVDESGSFGQFILTGSVTDATLPGSLYGEEKEKHTGTGRIIKKKMRTLSLFESGDSSGSVSLAGLKNGMFSPCICDRDLSDYAFFLCRGGWPLSIGEERSVALQQAKTFYNGLISEDFFSLKDVPLRKNEARANKIMRSYSRFISSEASTEAIQADLKESGDDVDKSSLSKYLLALNRLFVTDELEAWNPNLRSKTAIRTKNTRHFVDPSIAAAALRISPEQLFFDMRTFGLLFESMALRDLRIYAEANDAEVYHYRDKRGREADAVVCFEDGSWALIGVQLADMDEIAKSSAKLKKLADDIDIGEKRAFLAIVTATRTAYVDENGVYVIPLGCLRE